MQILSRSASAAFSSSPDSWCAFRAEPRSTAAHTRGVDHDQQVIEHVRRLRDDPVTVLAGTANHGFHCIFAELLGDCAAPLSQKLEGIGLLAEGGGAIDDALLEGSPK